jgi:hypothetical protein
MKSEESLRREKKKTLKEIKILLWVFIAVAILMCITFALEIFKLVG